jgi:hypothetical protein
VPLGRCAGCGRQGSARQVKIHILACQEYAALHQVAPEKCLGPDEEYARYKAQDDSPDARAERRDERLQRRFAELDQQQQMEARRWQPEPDILAD